MISFEDLQKIKIDNTRIPGYIKNNYPEIKKMTYSEANKYLVSKVFYGCEQIRKLVKDIKSNAYVEISATPNFPEKGFIEDFYSKCSNEEKMLLIVWYCNKISKENNLKLVDVNFLDVFNTSDSCIAYHLNHYSSYGINSSIIYTNFKQLIETNLGVWTFTCISHEMKHYADIQYYNGFTNNIENKPAFFNLNNLKKWNENKENYTINVNAILKSIEKSLLMNNNSNLIMDYKSKDFEKILQVLYLNSVNEQSANLYAIECQKALLLKYSDYMNNNEKNYINVFSIKYENNYKIADEIFCRNKELLTGSINDYVNTFSKINQKNYGKEENKAFLKFFALIQLLIKDPLKTYSIKDINEYLKPYDATYVL